jgi:hypothetical protein
MAHSSDGVLIATSSPHDSSSSAKIRRLWRASSSGNGSLGRDNDCLNGITDLVFSIYPWARFYAVSVIPNIGHLSNYPKLVRLQTGSTQGMEPVWMARSGLHLGQETVKEISALP